MALENKMRRFKVPADSANQRADVFLSTKLTELSRASVHKLFDQGLVTVNKEALKPSRAVKAGETVSVRYDSISKNAIPQIELPIVYEDADALVIHKPEGVLTHSKGAFNPEATVASFIKQKTPTLSGERDGIVHRLDRATSGVMLTAKNDTAHKWFQKQFSTRNVKKTYYAIIEGQLDEAEALIDVPIGRNPRKPQTFRAAHDGKLAQTHYHVIEERNGKSLLKLQPSTGRTHQLRVHLAFLGHPIVGDTLYGGKPAPRLFLHAESLELTMPNKARKVFGSKVPASFKNYMDEAE